MSIRARDVHRETAREAGFGTISPLSVGAGVLCAYGAFAIVAAIVGSILTAVDVDTEFRTDDWTSRGAAAALASAVRPVPRLPVRRLRRRADGPSARACCTASWSS